MVTIEFPYGKKYDENLLRSFPRRVKNIETNSYLATLAITVERRNVNNVAFIQLDSFDLTVGIKPKQK